MKANKVTALAVGCLATMILSNATWAQIVADVEPTQEKDLPTAEQVFAEYIRVTGGEENHRAMKSTVSSGSLTIDVNGTELDGEFAISQIAPNKVIIDTELESLGSQKKGFDGQVGWEITAREGAKILDGESLRLLKLQADMNQYLNMSDHFSEIKCVGEVNFNDEVCFAIEAANGEGSSPLTAFFSKESKLLVGSKMTLELPEASLQIVNEISDYRDVGNVKMSFKSVSTNQHYTQYITLEEIEINSEIDEAIFALPKEIQDLVDD